MRSNRRTIGRICYWLLAFLFLSLTGCGGGGGGGGTSGGGPTPVVSSKTILSGVVKDKSGSPVQGVTIEIDDQGQFSKVPMVMAKGSSKYSATAIANSVRAEARNHPSSDRAAKVYTVATDANGFFSISDVSFKSGKKLLLTMEKAGFATYQQLISPVAEGITPVEAVLAPVDLTTGPQAATSEIKVDASPAPGGTGRPLSVTIPANSLLDSFGNPVTGNVTVEVTLADPSNDQDRASFPGSFLAADMGQSVSAPETLLESIAFTEITIRDAATNQEITLVDQAHPVEIVFALPQKYQDEYAADPLTSTYNPLDEDRDSVPLWSYNETEGAWEREDADPSTQALDDAEVIDVNGVLSAKAKVLHFTWWNADVPVTRAYIRARVLDKDGHPVVNAPVQAKGVTYDTNAPVLLTDSQGYVTLTVKRSTAESTEQVKVQAMVNGFLFPEDGTEVTTTPLNDTPKDFVINAALGGKISGTVTSSTGQAVANIWVRSSTGTFGDKTDSNGNYSFDVPLNKAITVVCTGTTVPSVTVTLTSQSPEANAVNFQFPQASFDLALQFATGNSNAGIPPDFVRAREVLNVLELAGGLNDNAKLLSAAMEIVTVSEDAKFEGNPLNLMLTAMGLKAAQDPNTDEFKIFKVTEYCLEEEPWWNGGGCAVVNPYYDPNFVYTVLPDHLTVIPVLEQRLAKAKGYLASINKANVNFKVEDSEVDGSDVHTATAALELFEFMLDYLSSYDYQSVPQGTTLDNVYNLTPGALAQSRLTDAKTHLIAAITSYRAAVTAMKAETDSQYNDFMYLDAETVYQLGNLDGTIDGILSSINNGGSKPVPIFETTDTNVTSVTQSSSTGLISVTEEGRLLKGYANLDFSVLFDATKVFDGSKLKADVDNGKIVFDSVTELSWWDYWGWGDYYYQEQTRHFMRYTSDSYLATLQKSVAKDIKFRNEVKSYYYYDYNTLSVEEGQYVETDSAVPLSKTANGALQLDALDGNWPFSLSTFNGSSYLFDAGAAQWTNVDQAKYTIYDGWWDVQSRPTNTFSNLPSGLTLFNTPFDTNATTVQMIDGYTYTTRYIGKETVLVENIGEPPQTSVSYPGAAKFTVTVTGTGADDGFRKGTILLWFAQGKGLVKMVYAHQDGNTTTSELTGMDDYEGAAAVPQFFVPFAPHWEFYYRFSDPYNQETYLEQCSFNPFDYWYWSELGITPDFPSLNGTVTCWNGVDEAYMFIEYGGKADYGTHSEGAMVP